MTPPSLSAPKETRLATIGAVVPPSFSVSRSSSARGGWEVSPTDQAGTIALPIEKLLASGGDDRLALDPRTGLNRYGCAPYPRVGLVSFGSCTASSPSQGAFDAAERSRSALVAAALEDGYDVALRDRCSRIESEILDAFGCCGIAETVLAASGTDAALIVSAMLQGERPHVPLTSIILSPAETGSGVPLAVQCRHFATATALGVPVARGQLLAGIALPPRLVTIDVRDGLGDPLPPVGIATACEKAVREALAHGPVVLHAIDGSKTGLTAPDQASLVRLARTYGPQLDIVIDACQARVEPAQIRSYLEHGFPVLVTGSKFFGAPGFCGAILFPRERLLRMLTTTTAPAGLAAYTACEAGFGSRNCPGLLLRWAAALHEIARFRRLPDEEVSHRLDRIGAELRNALRARAELQLVEIPASARPGWSSRRSVFTFTVRGREGLLNPLALRRVYLELQHDLSGSHRAEEGVAAMRCQIGQPVQLGASGIGGLRIAISSSDIVRNADLGTCFSQILEKLALVLQSSTPRGQPAHAFGR